MLAVKLEEYEYAEILSERLAREEARQEAISDIIEDYVSSCDFAPTIQEFICHFNTNFNCFFGASQIISFLEKHNLSFIEMVKILKLDHEFEDEEYKEEEAKNILENFLENDDYSQEDLEELNQFLEDKLDNFFKIIYGENGRLCAYTIWG